MPRTMGENGGRGIVVFIGEKWRVTPSTSGKRAYKSVAIITTYLVNRDGSPHIFETTHQAASQLFPKQLNWLVVLTILKNSSQWKGLSHILWKIKNVPNHHSDMFVLAYVSSMLAHMNGM